MKAKKLQMITWMVIIGCTWLGGFIGVYIIGKESGKYALELVLSIGFGSIGGFIVFLVISKLNQKRKGNMPEIDERTVKILQKYLLIALYVVLFGSGALLLIVYAMGVKYIETSLLILFLLGIYLIVGLGTLVAKRI